MTHSRMNGNWVAKIQPYTCGSVCVNFEKKKKKGYGKNRDDVNLCEVFQNVQNKIKCYHQFLEKLNWEYFLNDQLGITLKLLEAKHRTHARCQNYSHTFLSHF